MPLTHTPSLIFSNYLHRLFNHSRVLFHILACPRVRLAPPVHSLILDWPFASVPSRLLHHVRYACYSRLHNHRSPPEIPPRVPAKFNMRIATNTIFHPQYYLHVPYGLLPLPVWFLKPSSLSQHHSFFILAPHRCRSRSPYSRLLTSVLRFLYHVFVQ